MSSTTKEINFAQALSIETPKKLTWFENINCYLFHISTVVFVQSLIVCGYFNSINTTVERRFKLTTREIGFMYMSYDMASIPSTIILSIIGHRLNRPRTIGIFGIILFIGILGFGFPHFMVDEYELKFCDMNSSEVLCNERVVGNKLNKTGILCNGTSDKWVLTVLCLAMSTIGIGSSPIYVLGPTYLWDNLPIKTYSIYSSIFYTNLALGPPVGFLLGAIFLGIYIDFPNIPNCPDINSKHTLWLGAWWLGLIILGGIILLTVLPLMKFKKVAYLKYTEKEKIESSKSKEEESYENIKNEFNLSNNVLEIKGSIFYLMELFTNPYWLFLTLLSVTEQSIILAAVTYVSKYLQIMYNVSANYAGYVVGGLVIPGAVIGLLMGGLLMHKFQPSFLATNKCLIIITVLTSGAIVTNMLLRCENNNFFENQFKYKTINVNNFDLSNECNLLCDCSLTMYEPLCDLKHRQNFYSPCHAGCHNKWVRQENDLNSSFKSIYYYTDCKCSLSAELVSGRCDTNCLTYYLALCLVVFQIFCTAIGQIPVNIMALSVVSSKRSSMALGVQLIIIHLLAFIPVPLIFGALFDLNCLLWVKDECNIGQLCNEYDVERLPYTWLGASLCYKFLSLVFSLIIYFFARNNPILNRSMKKLQSGKVQKMANQISDIGQQSL